MLANLSKSLYPVMHLIAGLGYLLGLLFFFAALMKLKAIGELPKSGHSEEKMSVVILYILMGAFLVFLPSTLTMLSYSAFGNGNILQYVPYNPYSVLNSMEIIIETAGLIWFVRGCTLIVHGSQPGKKEGKKGLTFIAAGILAMNFQASFQILNYVMDQLMSWTKGQ